MKGGGGKLDEGRLLYRVIPVHVLSSRPPDYIGRTGLSPPLPIFLAETVTQFDSSPSRSAELLSCMSR